MPTLSQLRDRVDAFIADKWPTLVARQENFRANRGRYWQGLRTHTIVPQHDNGKDGSSAGDRLAATPNDHFENWLNVFPEWDGVPIPCSLTVDTYDGPGGMGWVAKIEVSFNGKTYERAGNVGPESYRAFGWRVQDPDIP